jgi:adenylate cyclase
MVRFRYYFIAVAVLLIAILLPHLPIFSIVLKTLDLNIYDNILEVYNAFSYNEYEGVYDNICIIDIDEKSIKDLGSSSSGQVYFLQI